jgi:hypothetical protein
VFFRDSNDYILPMYLATKTIPLLNLGLYYVGYVQKVRDGCEYMITDKRGYAQGISELGMRVIEIAFSSFN